ncbi:hypothetical protein GH733_005919 [Mirounga leonina]|nr:hypothetical protein GH733_005919 [Mirounga leonina]
MLRMRTAGWARGWCLGCCLLLPLSLSLAAAKQLLRYRLAEEGPADVRIGNVASDLGIVTGSGEVTFSLESGSEYLKIDNLTGELSTSERRIDREKLPQCQMIFDENECFLDFEVSVIGPSQSWVDLFEGRVIVLDINDNTPTFPSPVLTLTVEENRPVGTLYLLPTATDRDFGRNGIERYELLQEPGGGGGGGGGGEGRRAGPADSAPYPGGGGNGGSRRRPDAPEGGGGTNAGGRSGVFELQVADTPDGEKQPQLIVKGALDREQRDSYELTLRVRDGGDPPRSSQAILRVLITDVNDNSPRFEKSVYEADLAENSAPGTPILQLRAADLDVGVNGQIEYVFGAATESVRRLLRLDETSGWLSVLHRIDREEVNQLRFTVMARDRGQPPKTDKATVVLNIKDENDNVPSIEIRKIGRIPLKDGVANVAEDVLVDTPIALVQVSDRDQGENGVVTCTVVGDVPFQLKPASDTEGDQNKKKYFLHTSAPLDYETTREFNVVIVAVDSGSPSLSSNNSLVVKVGDTNDNPPVFGQSVVEVYFPENNIPGERVATVLATDADSGKNAEIAYSLDSSVMGIFAIDPDSGDILVNTVLDREQTDRYEFKVNAKDKGIPVLQGSTTVIVQVADKNDNDPKFMQDVFTFYVKENLQPNSPVGMVTVMDADKGRNAEMSLYIEENIADVIHRAKEQVACKLLLDSRPLPDVALTGKCTRECDEYGHSDSCWMPVRTSPERKKSQPKLSTFMPVDERGSQEKLANGEAAIMGDRNRNLLNKKLTSSYETFSAASFSKNEEANPEDIPLTKTGEYKPSPVNTLTRREVYLHVGASGLAERRQRRGIGLSASGPKGSGSGAMSRGTPYIGSKISLISKAEIRTYP